MAGPWTGDDEGQLPGPTRARSAGSPWGVASVAAVRLVVLLTMPPEFLLYVRRRVISPL
jgi:hypothetical protein